MDDVSNAGEPRQDALALDAIARVLAPLSQLLLHSGVQYQPLADLIKQVLVDVARRTIPDAAQARSVSRISLATGIHRKEVKRLLETPIRLQDQAGRSAASVLFTRWLTDARFLDDSGRPRVLSRQPHDDGRVSFDSLAREVSSDVHPRSMLQELLRLGLVTSDDRQVSVCRESFVPATEQRQMYRFLGDNVADHLAAAVANVQGGVPPHLEQALFAEGLSHQSVQEIDRLVRDQWKRMFGELVPQIERLLAEDRSAGRDRDHRLRVGMYAYAPALEVDAPLRAADEAADATGNGPGPRKGGK